MTTQQKQNITTQIATDLLNNGKPLKDFYISGELIIEGNIWGKEVIFENCVIEYFSGSCTSFNKPVRMINCHLKKCQFLFTHFLGGLKIDNCTFDKYLNFQSGGHNKTGNPIIVTNNDFEDFVDFFDCWYESEVTICNNRFHKGTNLLGKPHNIPVKFEIEPITKDNFGRLDLKKEGEKSQ